MTLTPLVYKRPKCAEATRASAHTDGAILYHATNIYSAMSLICDIEVPTFK